VLLSTVSCPCFPLPLLLLRKLPPHRAIRKVGIVNVHVVICGILDDVENLLLVHHFVFERTEN